jgi:hypothetical protein
MEIPADAQRIEIVTEVDDTKTHGFAIRRDLGKHERLARAGKMFGIFFGVALLTVFIPILHFILPPLFLIAGIVFFWTTYMETGEVLEGEYICPNCKHKMVIPPGAEDWPKEERCGGCSFLLKTQPVK